jgi:DNA repair protein RecO (recombination protein O)
MKQITLQPAYLLHRRAYRESSFLIELLTQDYGRITAVARGVRKPKSGTQGVLQQFTPLLVSWAGNGELVTLTHVEANGPLHVLRGNCLFAGFYINELMMCLLQKADPHPTLYFLYEKTLTALQGSILEPRVLRSFEKNFLEELGYGVLTNGSQALDQLISGEKFYRFVPEQGFVASDIGEFSQEKANIFAGKNLLAIANEDWQNEECLQDAKRLTRLILMPLLGSRTIHSRKLFILV